MHNIRTSYKSYKETSEKPVGLEEYVRIINKFNKFIMANVFLGREIRLPAKTGTISIKGKKLKIKYDEKGRLKGFAPDYKATKELWIKCPECKENKQLVYHLNEHTNGIRYKFFWSKDRVFVNFKNFYTLIFTRTNKRFLSNLINQGKDFYVDLNRY